MAAAAARINPNITEVKIPILLNNLTKFQFHETEIFHAENHPFKVKLKKIDGNLAVYLYSELEYVSDDLVVFVEYKFELISLSSNKKSHEMINTVLFCLKTSKKDWGSKKIIAWDQLMNLKNGYVQNDWCITEVTTKVSPLQDTSKTDFISQQNETQKPNFD